MKLKLIKNVFAPKLRKRYPHTKIVVFDDWHSCPQWPHDESKGEKTRFNKAMEHMNSMYVYCDVVLFLEAELPTLDNVIRKCILNPSNHEWSFFIDSIQFQSRSSNLAIQKNDIVVDVDGSSSTALSLDAVKKLNKDVTVSYLRRPYGRPNRTPADDRGWLFAERITIAIKMATAPETQFDDVVLSNNEDLRNQIFKWSQIMREGARKEKTKPGSISDTLEHFKSILANKKFSWPNNDTLVIEIMENLIQKFRTNWDEEVKRQSSMAKRARELLLRWGCFSEQYVDRAGFLKDNEMSSRDVMNSVSRILVIGVVAPSLAMMPFIFEITKDPEEDMFWTSLWFGVVTAVVPVLFGSPLTAEFAGVPYGVHNIFDVFILAVDHFFVSFVCLRMLFGVSIVPLEYLCVIALCLIVINPIVLGTKWIPMTHPKTGKSVRVSLHILNKLPLNMVFDMKAISDFNRVDKLFELTSAFGFFYPVLAGIFFNSGIFVQSILVLVFFALRTCYEIAADSITTKTFGSDAMPVVSFGGVCMHEICLSFMMTSINHPLVFTILVLADVLENTFCLYSLYRTVSSIGNQKIVPLNDDVEEMTEEKQHTNEEAPRKSSLTKRTSSVYNLVQNLKTKSPKERHGTALFIVATLLQREMIETIVPIQSFGVLSVLYWVDVKSNSLVSGWDSSDYHQALMYTGIDLGVELLVFGFTIFFLSQIFPELKPWRILSGLVRMHFASMLMIMTTAWLGNLLLQCTFSGMDPLFRFEWLSCENVENSTWIGGFEWDC